MEALSRGAAEVVFVDQQPRVISQIRQNLEMLDTDAETVVGDALNYLFQAGPQFDLVFLDPPFRREILPGFLNKLPARLMDESHIYIEAENDLLLEFPPGFELLKRKTAGQVGYHWLAYHACTA